MKKRCLTVFVSFLLLLTVLILQIAKNYNKAFDSFAETSVKTHIKLKINEIITKKLDSSNMQIDEIIYINSNSEGRIISIIVNTPLINRILFEIEKEILNETDLSSLTLGIPIGNLLGFKLTSGKGPKLDVIINPISVTANKPKSELMSSGINQTLHRICVDFSSEIICLAPFYETKCTVSTTIILSEILIVGEIPDVIVSPVG